MKNNYTPTIGLEIHTELKTKSKLFCGCKNDPFCKGPNIYTCPVCLGLPGALPVINRQAVIDTIRIGKALNGTIAPITKWDRKHYFYPDLPKGYQISQFDLPLVKGGQIEISNFQFPISNKLSNFNNQTTKNQEPRTNIRITRIHLEEDTGKLVHEPSSDTSLVDYNRAGVPLVELVTEPDIHDGKTAAEFAREYQLILRTLGVADANMEKGMMRVEVNISLQQNQKSKIKNQNLSREEPRDDKEKIKNERNQLGTKVEIKNLNSFKSVERAIDYEIKRQTERLEKGEIIVQETRGWDDRRGTTISQRVKETSADYRYFPEPDLPPIDTGLLSIPETTPLPTDNRNRLKAYGISDKDIEILLNQPELYSRLSEFSIFNFQFSSKSQTINPKQEIIAEVAKLLIHYPQARDKSTEELIKLAQLSPHQRKLALRGETHDQLLGEDEIKSIIDNVLTKEVPAVADYQAGKQAVYGFLVGQIMRECKGKADPAVVNHLLKEKFI